jgi:hypothetical protein
VPLLPSLPPVPLPPGDEPIAVSADAGDVHVDVVVDPRASEPVTAELTLRDPADPAAAPTLGIAP